MMKINYYILFLLVCICSSSVLSQVNYETKLFQTQQGHFYIEVMINNAGPYRMIVDTAASVTFLRNDVIKEIGLSEIPGASLSVEGAGGTIQLNYYKINNLKIGTNSLSNIKMAGQISPKWPEFGEEIHGILGFDIMGANNLWFSQSTEQLLILSEIDESINQSNGWESIAFKSY